MKKIFSILFLALGLLVVASCSDDEVANPYAHESTIAVDSSQVLFGASAATGSVHVNSPQGVTKVESSQPWCTATVNGNQIDVTVTQNDSYEGRAAQLTIYSAAGDYVQVTVQQMGFVLQLSAGNSITVGDEAATHAYGMKHNTEVTFSTDEDWMSATVVGDSLKITFAENATKNMRSGWLKYQSGSISDSIFVRQFEFDKDLLGTYAMLYIGTDGWEYLLVDMQKKADNSYALKFLDDPFASLGFEIPLEVNPQTPSIQIFNLKPVGDYNNLKIISMVMGLEGTSIYRYSSATANMEGAYNQNDDGTYTWDFVGNNISDRELYGLRLAASSDGTYAGYQGALFTFPYCYLQRMTE